METIVVRKEHKVENMHVESMVNVEDRSLSMMLPDMNLRTNGNVLMITEFDEEGNSKAIKTIDMTATTAYDLVNMIVNNYLNR